MTELITQPVDVFMLDRPSDFQDAVNAVYNGKMTLLKVGSVFSFVFSPYIEGLNEKLTVMKGRKKGQLTSVICTYEQAKRIVDRKRVNPDFYHITAELTCRMLIRIPIDTSLGYPFPYDVTEGTMQFINFEKAHPVRCAFRDELAAKGLEYLSITSGNLHGLPTIESFDDARRLAALLNLKASFMERSGFETVVSEIPGDQNAHRGSYIILSFCNLNAIEVKRLAHINDRETTERYLAALFGGMHTLTPLVYAL